MTLDVNVYMARVYLYKDLLDEFILMTGVVLQPECSYASFCLLVTDFKKLCIILHHKGK